MLSISFIIQFIFKHVDFYGLLVQNYTFILKYFKLLHKKHVVIIYKVRNACKGL